MRPLSRDRIETDRRELWERARVAKVEEEAAFKRYSAAGAAVDAAHNSAAAKAELEAATSAWKRACRTYEQARERTLA